MELCFVLFSKSITLFSEKQALAFVILPFTATCKWQKAFFLSYLEGITTYHQGISVKTGRWQWGWRVIGRFMSRILSKWSNWLAGITGSDDVSRECICQPGLMGWKPRSPALEALSHSHAPPLHWLSRLGERFFSFLLLLPSSLPPSSSSFWKWWVIFSAFRSALALPLLLKCSRRILLLWDVQGSPWAPSLSVALEWVGASCCVALPLFSCALCL